MADCAVSKYYTKELEDNTIKSYEFDSMDEMCFIIGIEKKFEISLREILIKKGLTFLEYAEIIRKIKTDFSMENIQKGLKVRYQDEEWVVIGTFDKKGMHLLKLQKEGTNVQTSACHNEVEIIE